MEFIKIDFPDEAFSSQDNKRNSMYEDPKPGETIPAVGMFLSPTFTEGKNEGQAES